MARQQVTHYLSLAVAPTAVNVCLEGLQRVDVVQLPSYQNYTEKVLKDCVAVSISVKLDNFMLLMHEKRHIDQITELSVTIPKHSCYNGLAVAQPMARFQDGGSNQYIYLHLHGNIIAEEQMLVSKSTSSSLQSLPHLLLLMQDGC